MKSKRLARELLYQGAFESLPRVTTMPLYEFKCRKCDQQFEERLTSYNDIPDVVCPDCGSESVEKLLSLFATSGGQSANSGPSYSSSGCGGGGGFT